MFRRPASPSAARRRGLALVLGLALALLAGGIVSPGTASAVVGVPVTYVDHSYSSSVTRPSENKPQSKLWYHDGSWWALMVEAGGTAVRIHQLMADHTWRNTGALVDSRINSTGDALWSARDQRLYVASRAGGSNLQVNAFIYTGGTWQVAPGFPVVVNSGGGSESATIDQDSTGRLWVTYTRASRLWVAHSTTSTTQWTAGYQPPGVDTVIRSDDISTLITFGASVGVLYSDQESGAVRFAVYDSAGDPAAPEVWRVEEALVGAGLADDHLNIKQIVGDSTGRIYAAVKTSADEVTTDPNAVLVGVLVRTPGVNGQPAVWELEPAGTLGDNHTRPIMMLDSTNQELYFFATSSGDIVYKKSRLSDIEFPPGRGTPFVNTQASLNNASGAKDPVTAATGMVIMATADVPKQYVHAEMELAGGGTTPPPDGTAPTATTNPTAGQVNVNAAADVTATFSEPVAGVSGTTFTLTNAAGAAVTATVSYDDATRTARLNPASNLSAGTQYTATLGEAPGIRDAAGNAFEPLSWTFTTASSGPIAGAPTVTNRSPAPDAKGVGPAANVTATFSEAVLGVDRTTFTVTNTKTNAVVAATVTRSGTTNRWILNPSANLAADTLHTVTLTGGTAAIRDAGGIPLQSVSWQFQTGPAPTVTTRSPATNAIGINTEANVLVTFSEAVLNVTTTTLSLRNAATGGAVSATVTRDRTTNRWILDPSTTLLTGTRYTVTVVGRAGGVTDLAGNPLAANVTWSFTTS